MAYKLNAMQLAMALLGFAAGLGIGKYMSKQTQSAGAAALAPLLAFALGVSAKTQNRVQEAAIVLLGFAAGILYGRRRAVAEGFEGPGSSCPDPDPSLWVLKATVPPCPPMPDMSKYMLKTECPPLPDMSKYVLKSSVPKCPPCISTCSKPCKIGECPPCPRPRCPVVKCPEPKACAPCPAATCAPCPEPKLKCNATYEPTEPVRPMLASTSTFGF